MEVPGLTFEFIQFRRNIFYRNVTTKSCTISKNVDFTAEYRILQLALLRPLSHRLYLTHTILLYMQSCQCQWKIFVRLIFFALLTYVVQLYISTVKISFKWKEFLIMRAYHFRTCHLYDHIVLHKRIGV